MQRRKAVAIVVIRIGAELEQPADEGERTPVDRVGQAGSDRERHQAVRNDRRIVDGGAERLEVAGLECRVDAIEIFCLAAAFIFGLHGDVHIVTCDFASVRRRFTDVSISFCSVGVCTSSRRLMYRQPTPIEFGPSFASSFSSLPPIK